jgi:DNA-binding NarL/FixJ family response regulator
VIRLLIAEDNDFFRGALVDFLSTSGDLDVVAECADGDEVELAFDRTQPDVVVLDLAMPRLGGLEAGRRLLTRHPDARVVIFTGTPSAAAVREARRIGAKGYLLKTLTPESLLSELRAVAAGRTVWHNGVDHSSN